MKRLASVAVACAVLSTPARCVRAQAVIVPLCRACRPTVTDADTAAYYVEARYKVTPKLFTALRWNQQLFGEVSDGQGGDRPWDRDVWRIDTAVGYRFDRHLQAKLQYSYTRQAGDLQQGEQLVAMQLTLKF